MDKDVYPDKNVGEFFNDHFISVRIDAEDGGAVRRSATKYEANVFPSLLFVHPRGSVISSFIGMHTIPELVHAGQYVRE